MIRPNRPSPVLVGQCPPPGIPPEKAEPLYPVPRRCAGNRLYHMCARAMDGEFTMADYLRTFWRVNVSETHVRRFRPSAIPPKRILGIQADFRDDRALSVVFMGPAVAECFDLRGSFFQWCTGPGYSYAVFPHPSGRNRIWRSESNRLHAEAFLRDLILRQRGEHEAVELRTGLP